ncbi:MAG: hypothetical protein ACKVP7_13475 [Hyphomicrobiaceae bacterium]
MEGRLKASLAPKQRSDRGGRWFPRGTWSEIDEHGTRIERRGWRGGGFATKAECQEECERLNSELVAHAERAQSGIPCFAVAAATYGQLNANAVQLHHHLARAAEIIGDVPVNLVDDAVVLRVTAALYPSGAQPSTLNRHVFTPIISVLKHAAKGKQWTVNITRPSGHAIRKPVESPETIEWYRRVLPLCSPNLRALVLFCRLHNRRGCDGFRALGKHLNGEFLDIVPPADRKSKTKAERIQLSEPVLAAIEAAGEKGPDRPLFGYSYATRRNAWRDLKTACTKAGVVMYSLHKSGRHAFSKHHLDSGGSLADLTQLGRWADPALPAMLYGYREQTALDGKYLPKANAFGVEISGPAKKRSDRGET